MTLLDLLLFMEMVPSGADLSVHDRITLWSCVDTICHMLGRLGGWRPVLAAFSVVLSALIGLATNVVTDGGTFTLVVAVGGLVALAAGLAFYDSRPRPASHTPAVTTVPVVATRSRGTTWPPLDALRAEVARIARTPMLLVVCGYDGTLLNDVGPLPESLAALERLARLPRTAAAVISGRALRDLVASSRLSEEVRLVGSYGAEFDLSLATSLPPTLRQQHHELVQAVLRLVNGVSAARMEIKPAGVSVHLADPWAARALREGPGSRPGITLIECGGTIDLSVLPAHDGHALDRLRTETNADAVVFIGDAVHDGPSLARLREGDLGIETADPQGVADILDQLVRYRRRWLDSARVVEIERHSMLAGGGTVALLTPEARLTWLCHPRPHSAAVFADLLGGPAAGYFSVEPAHGAAPLQQRYRSSTMTVETRWPGLTVTDWLDDGPGQAVMLRLLRGQGIAHVEFAPRPEFGRLPVRLQPVGDGLLLLGSNQPMALCAKGIEWHLRLEGASLTASADIDLTARGGEVALELRLGTDDLTPHRDRASVRLSRAESAWIAWARSLKLPTVATEEVRRSALTMRALWYPRTGAVLAAATTSLPQTFGGTRNWDYRYCWLRDAAICARALVHLGSYTEAESLLRWISLRSRDENGSPAWFSPVYTVDGQDIPAESIIDDLPGYAGSRPVRIGNAAYRLLPLDVFGFIADLIASLAEVRAPESQDLVLLERMVDTVAKRWHEPDHGFWEIRLPPRHHVHSKVMCWLTVDRALRVQSQLGLDQPRSWLDLRERIGSNVLARGWDGRAGTFTTAYGEPALDAGTLWVGISGLLDRDDPRFAATVATVNKQLRKGPAVRPYRHDDGVSGNSACIHMCTSWLIEALALTGQHAEAQELFNAMLSCLGPTGLLSEGYDPIAERGAGNHPQAFSHAGLVQAALALDGLHSLS